MSMSTRWNTYSIQLDNSYFLDTPFIQKLLKTSIEREREAPHTVRDVGVLVASAVLVDAFMGFVGRILMGRFQTSVSTLRELGPCHMAISDWSAGITCSGDGSLAVMNSK